MATLNAVPADLANQYQAAVNGGDTTTANYLAQAIAQVAGINSNTNDVSAASSSAVNTAMGGYTSSSQPSKSTGFSLSDIEGILTGGIFGNQNAGIVGAGIDAATSAAESIPQAISSAGAAIAAPFKGVGTFFDFITNIPRVLTILVGVILVIVGLYMLGNKQIIAAVQTVSKALPEAA